MTRTDTADRLRISDLVLIDGTWVLIEDLASASSPAHPGRLALGVVDPHSSWATQPTTVHIYAGDTVTYRAGSTHLADCVGLRPGGIRIA